MESFEAFIMRIGELLDRVDQLDDEWREDIYELLDAIDTLHRRGMATLVGALDEDAVARVREDDFTSWLLDAYGVQFEPSPGSVSVQITRKR